MRAVVLLLLVGSLSWLVWRNFGSTRAGNEAHETARGGYFLPADPAPLPSIGEVGAAADIDRSGNASPVEPHPEPAGETLAEQPSDSKREQSHLTPAAAITEADASTPEEIELASELLHRPEKLGEYLATRGKSMTASRRALAIAFAQALVGDGAEARRLAQTLGADPTAGTAGERALLERVTSPERDRPVAASISRETPLLLAATMGFLAHAGTAAIENGDHRQAAGIFSELLLGELHAPWRAEQNTLRGWTDELRRAQDGYQWNRRAGWQSYEVTVEKGESLISIRKRVLADHPDLFVSTGLIERANQLSGTSIQPGQLLRIPSERVHVLVDVDAHWVLYFIGDLVAAAWAVGVGKPGSETPPGAYSVGDKNTEPMWFPPGRQPVPFGHPDNPLGTRWIGWIGSDGRNSRLAFHGTRDPASIGEDQSQGCVRMLNADVEELFEILPKGATVIVQP